MQSLFAQYSHGLHEIEYLGKPSWLIVQCWGELLVAKMGAQILHYQPLEQQPVFWLNEVQQGSHSKPSDSAVPEAVRGGVPLCWPWFGPHDDPTQPKHGLARTAQWHLHQDTQLDAGAQLCRLCFVPAQPLESPLAVQLQLEISNNLLQITLTTENVSTAEQPLTQALHSYFLVSDCAAIELQGLKNSNYFDKLEAGALKQQLQTLSNIQAIDNIYHHSGTVTIIDPGMARNIVVTKKSSRSTVVWNPGAAARELDIVTAEQFICVEAANTQVDQLVLSPGQKVSLQQSIVIETSNG
ncbi:MAG: hypothetical protein OFPI_29380 [Osedax symbiont Rs2]|nr:MAG: hypothetical protein OFPI_29380 [Osedax symbiont Rs2]